MKYLTNLVKDAIPLHQHTNYEIVIYTKGNGFLKTPDMSYPVGPGTISIIPPGIMHKSEFTEDFEEIFINGDFEQMFNLSSPALIHIDLDSEGIQLANIIYRNRYANSDYLGALCNAMAHFLVQNLEMDDEVSRAVNEIKNEIIRSFHDCNINLKSILEKSGYAEDYIRAHFKKITAQTPIEFLTRMRIRHACYLMDVYKNALSLSEIAEKCGYTDYIYFSRRFKQQMGVSPRAYKGASTPEHT